MPEEKRKINAWIPVSLYNKLETAGYDNITQALIKALESFFEDPGQDTKGSSEDITGYIQDTFRKSQDIETLTTENVQLKEDLKGYLQDIEGYHKDIAGYKQDIIRIQQDTERIQEGYKQDITGYKESIKALNVEISRLKEEIVKAPDLSEFSRIQARSEELERHIQTLKEELNKSGQREEDLKQMHNNYFLQVQTLINQKAIEAPAAEKKKPWFKFW